MSPPTLVEENQITMNALVEGARLTAARSALAAS
jgi:hypothetical protein